ncbi:MAG: aldo/keto reductase, partial [Rhizobiales bacterium]|nr:aldo/keto reductase [Hyphomicrobiales bacterium]
TAAAYGNEAAVGEGLRASGVPRQEVFVTTKVMPDDLEDRAFQRTLDRSLDQLGIGEVDLVLIHWPSRDLPMTDCMASLNHARARGAARHIGVSNFTTALLRAAWAATDAPLATNQCEYHPYLAQDAVLAACREWGMAFTAYSPLGRQRVLDDPVIAGIAARHGRTAAQVVLRWEIQQPGVVGRRDDPQERDAGAHRGESRRLRLRADRGRDGGDLGTRRKPAPHRQFRRARAGLGRLARVPRPPRPIRHRGVPPRGKWCSVPLLVRGASGWG